MKTPEEILHKHFVKNSIIGPDYRIEDEFSEEGLTAVTGAMQEYSSIQVDTYKKSLLSYLEHEQDGCSDDSEYKALERVIQFINAKHIDNQILSNTKP